MYAAWGHSEWKKGQKSFILKTEQFSKNGSGESELKEAQNNEITQHNLIQAITRNNTTDDGTKCKDYSPTEAEAILLITSSLGW